MYILICVLGGIAFMHIGNGWKNLNSFKIKNDDFWIHE